MSSSGEKMFALSKALPVLLRNAHELTERNIIERKTNEIKLFMYQIFS